MRTSVPVRVAQYAALAGFVVFLGFPLLWLFSTAFKSPPELTKLNPTLLPTDWTLGNFATALRQNQLAGALRNSLIVAVSTAVITTVIALPAAYALARYRSKVRTISVAWILVSQVFPFILIVIPVFIVLRNLGLIAGIELQGRDGQPTHRAMQVFQRCFDAGLLIRTTGDIIALSPPLIVEEKHVDRIVETLTDAIRAEAA